MSIVLRSDIDIVKVEAWRYKNEFPVKIIGKECKKALICAGQCQLSMESIKISKSRGKFVNVTIACYKKKTDEVREEK